MITYKELQEKIQNTEVETINIEDIKFEKNHYSRKRGIDQKAINDYSQNIINMPPIIINHDNKIINGVHRYKALQKAEQKQCKVKHIKIDDSDLMLAGLLIDHRQGVRHPREDFKYVLVKDFEKRPGINKEVAKELGIPERTANEWTKDIRKEKQKEVNEGIALDLLNPNMTQQQIADKWGYKYNRIYQIKEEIASILAKLAEIEVADLQQQDYDFLEDYKEFVENEIFLYNIWNTPKGDETSYFGHFPLIFMENLLYYFTEPFDIVYDPFAGGGTTIDACKKLLRKYICSDLHPIGNRQDEIKQHDITQGLPENLQQKPDFVFLDPPYWKQAKGKYTNEKTDLSNITLEEFYNSLENLIKQLKQKKVNRIAYVISPIQWPNENHEFIEPYTKINNMLKDKYKCEMIINMPYSTEQYNGTQVDIAKKEKIMLNTTRLMWIWKIIRKEKN